MWARGGDDCAWVPACVRSKGPRLDSIDRQRSVVSDSVRPPLSRLTTRSGKELPPLVLGTAALGSIDPTGLWGRGERRRAFELLDSVFEEGCRAFDLARSYKVGGTERVFGEWLRRSGVREEIFILSKAGHPFPVIAPNRLGTPALEQDLFTTLRLLGVEYVDSWMLHRDHEEVALSRLAADLARFAAEGFTRFTGVSNWTFERITSLEDASAHSVVHASSPQFSLAAWKASPWQGCWSISGRKHRYERRQYARASMPVFAYCALGQGFLTSKRGRAQRGPFHQRASVEQRQRCADLASRRGTTTAQVALAYLLNQPFPVFPIVGVSRRGRMRENLEAVAIELSSEELAWLEDAARPLEHVHEVRT